MDRVLGALLKDPMSKVVTYGTPEKGWYRKLFSATDKFGWLVPCMVNAKNAFGAYTGKKQWLFFFVYGKCVAWRNEEGLIREIGSGGLTAEEARVGEAQAAPPK